MCELPKVHDVTHPIARKSRRCCECHDPIAIGERYERITGLWDLSWSTFATCLQCAELRDFVIAWSDEDCIEYGGIVETLAQFNREQIPTAPRDEREARAIGRALGLVWQRCERRAA